MNSRYRALAACLPLLLAACAARPPKSVRLPPVLNEASGLAVRGDTLYWHNDSGDGPFLYATDLEGQLFGRDSLAAGAVDYEDLTTDGKGHFYLGDFGNNQGRRPEMTVYRFHPATATTAAIRFTFPGQDGRGRTYPGNPDCEAMVFQGGYLHLFTKDLLFGGGRYFTYHYRVPAAPGEYVAELMDSLYLPRRVVTAAALDTVRRQLVLTAYYFQRTLGLPNGAASLLTLSDYPDNEFLRGKVHRRNLSWFWPTQFEAVDFYDERWLYVASEATRLRKHAVAKRKRRRR